MASIPKEQRSLAYAAIAKIRYQFPQTPEGKLMFGVLSRAILDLLSRGQRARATKYLNGRLEVALICGVDPDWVRLVLKTMKLPGFDDATRR